MKHFYYAKQQELLELIFQFETSYQNGEELNMEEWAFAQIADYYQEINLSDKALEIIELGLIQYHCSPTLHARKANLLLCQQDEDQALELLDQAEAYGHSLIQTELLRAKAHAQKQDFEMALCVLNNIKSHPAASRVDRSNIYYTEASVYEKQEEYEPMFFALRESLRLDSSNQHALNRLYFCQDMCGMNQESIELCNYLIDQNPYCSLAWYNLGHAFYSTYNYRKAIEAFEYSFITNEDFPPAYYDCADVCMQIGEYGKALTCLEELLQFEVPSGELLLRIGQCHENLGNFEKARIFFFRALSRHPKHDEIYFHLGQCFAKQQIWDSAAHFYKEAVSREQNREDYLSALADVYIRLGRFKEAEPLLVEATRILPELSFIWMQLARFYITIGQFQKALDALEESEEDAFGAEILYARAACYAHMDLEPLMLNSLGEALEEDFEGYYLFFELAPKMRFNDQVLAAIKYYRHDF